MALLDELLGPESINSALQNIDEMNERNRRASLLQKLQSLDQQQAAVEAYKPQVDLSVPINYLASMTGNTQAAKGYTPPVDYLTRIAQIQKISPDRVVAEENPMETLKAKLAIAGALADNSRKKSSNVGLKEQLQIDALMRKRDKELEKETPGGKLKALNTSDKDRFDKIVFGLSSLRQLEDAVGAGENRVLGVDLNKISPVGDNPYTFARSQFEEAIGRLQSGGAINKEEEGRFRKLVPTPIDSPEVSEKKLKEMRDLFEQKFRTFGFGKEDASGLGLDPEMLGFTPKQIEARKPKTSPGDGMAAPVGRTEEEKKKHEELKKKYGK